MRFPPGTMGPDGKVYPCNDYRTNAQACGEAIYNAPRVAKLAVGMSLLNARQVMGRDPEERTVRTVDGKVVERWSYLTNYDSSIVSRITFTEGRITAIESERLQ